MMTMKKLLVATATAGLLLAGTAQTANAAPASLPQAWHLSQAPGIKFHSSAPTGWSLQMAPGKRLSTSAPGKKLEKSFSLLAYVKFR